jgi:hypothetical protein
MTPSFRTKLGLALFVPLAAALMATFACLPAPVGDPETAKIDEALSGAWQGVPKTAENKDVGLVLFQPWDAHTYLLRYLAIENKEGKESRQLATYKAWLTTLGGTTFVTAQPMDDLRYGPAADPQSKRFWVVMRLDKKGDGTLDMRIVSPEAEALKGKETREALEAAIKANAEEKALYADALTFKKLGKDEQLKLEETLKKFGIETP